MSTDAPDWDLVPFDVQCARCGEDLRGLTDPCCPACELSFDWSDAVPIDSLTCEHCDYRLYGLRETRCPECGEPFTWASVIQAHHRRKYGLFEYRWPEQPLPSLVASWKGAIRPWSFWKRVSINDPPATKPLWVLVGIALLCMFCTLSLLEGGMRSFFSGAPWFRAMRWWGGIGGAYSGNLMRGALLGDSLGEAVIAVYENMMRVLVFAGPVWALATLAALTVFRSSMRRYRVRWVHLLRIWTYAVVLPLTILPLAYYALQLIVFGLVTLNWSGRLPANSWLGALLNPALAAIPFLLLVCWSLRNACAHYLRMPHGTAVAVASQVLALLFTLTAFVVVSL